MKHRRATWELTDADLSRARAVGLSDGEIVEAVANVALNIFENYIGHVACVSIDIPQNESRETASQEANQMANVEKYDALIVGA